MELFTCKSCKIEKQKKDFNRSELPDLSEVDISEYNQLEICKKQDSEQSKRSKSFPTLQRCRACIKIKNFKRRDAMRSFHLKRKYNMDPDEYARKMTAQEGLCAICNMRSEKNLHVDHNHESGQVRDLLCSRCNTGLGLFRESKDILGSATKYLEKWTNA